MNYMKQVQKAVQKFMTEENDDKISHHEAAHLMLFRHRMPETMPYVTILADGRIGIDFGASRNTAIRDPRYFDCLLAGYAAELLYQKTTDRAVLEGAADRLIQGCRSARQAGYFNQADDYVAWYLTGYDANAKAIFAEAFRRIIDYIKKNMDEFIRTVREVRESGALERDDKSRMPKTLVKIA